MSHPVRAIVAVSPDGIIGVRGGMPWKKKEDLKRFKLTTMGGTLVMGRKTWWSIGRRKLPGRETIVVSRRVQEDDVLTCSSLGSALIIAETNNTPVWIAGGAEIYDLAMPHIEEFDVTVVTDATLDSIKSWEEFTPPVLSELADTRTYFRPFIEGMPGFTLKSETQNQEDPTLLHRLYVRA